MQEGRPDVVTNGIGSARRQVSTSSSSRSLPKHERKPAEEPVNCAQPFLGECSCFGGYRTGFLPRLLESGKLDDESKASAFTAVAPTKPSDGKNGEGLTPNDTASPRSAGRSETSSSSTLGSASEGGFSAVGALKSGDSESRSDSKPNVPRLRLGGLTPALSYRGVVAERVAEVEILKNPDSQSTGLGAGPLSSKPLSHEGNGTLPAMEVSKLAGPTPNQAAAAGTCGRRKLTKAQKSFAKQCMRKVKLMDNATRTPFILVEVRGYGNGRGSIEICGKDEFEVYKSLHTWLTNSLHCRKIDCLIDEDSKLSFCDARYQWDGFRELDTGMNNIGLVTMHLVEFMCGKLSWTLGMVNGGNLGTHGEIRDQQVVFKAPHPMNLVVPHVLLEMRSTGSFQLSGSDSRCMDVIERILVSNYSAQRTDDFKDFCHRGYKVGDDVFLERGTYGENNLGLLTVRMCDYVVQSLSGWSLVTMNGGNFGEDGRVREQQLFFRRDMHPQGEAPHLMVELREAGYIEFSGENESGIHEKLEEFLSEQWGCYEPDEHGKRTKQKGPRPSGVSQDAEFMSKDDSKSLDDNKSEDDLDRMISSLSATMYWHKKLVWPLRDIHIAAAELTGFFHQLGWQMLVCSTGAVDIEEWKGCREQQILFRPLGSQKGVIEPHLFIELDMGDVETDLEATQIPKGQCIKLRTVGDCKQGARKVGQFIEWLGGSYYVDDGLNQNFHIEIFMLHGLTASNLGQWTMRMCDLIVDRLGWSFVVCNVCNLGTYGQRRVQQLVFRYDGERIEIPPPVRAGAESTVLDRRRYEDFKFPKYWTSPEVLALQQTYSIIPCDTAESQAIQEIFDATFSRSSSKEAPVGLTVVQVFRCEHLELLKGFMDRREAFKGAITFATQTQQAHGLLNSRLLAGEALLLHGTSPSSAMGILKSGFVLGNVGKAAGVTYGSGIYLAENVTFCDRNATDDKGGNYPGLYAMLVCRCLLGRPMLVHEQGDHVTTARLKRFDSVVGDLPQKTGKFREFVFWDDAQILPEYAVIYQRKYASFGDPYHRMSGAERRCCCSVQ